MFFKNKNSEDFLMKKKPATTARRTALGCEGSSPDLNDFDDLPLVNNQPLIFKFSSNLMMIKGRLQK